jgi:hypothetical protein
VTAAWNISKRFRNAGDASKGTSKRETLRNGVQSKVIVTGGSIGCSFFKNQQLGHTRDLFLKPKMLSILPQWSELFSPDGVTDTDFLHSSYANSSECSLT